MNLFIKYRICIGSRISITDNVREREKLHGLNNNKYTCNFCVLFQVLHVVQRKHTQEEKIENEEIRERLLGTFSIVQSGNRIGRGQNYLKM